MSWCTWFRVFLDKYVFSGGFLGNDSKWTEKCISNCQDSYVHIVSCHRVPYFSCFKKNHCYSKFSGKEWKFLPNSRVRIIILLPEFFLRKIPLKEWKFLSLKFWVKGFLPKFRESNRNSEKKFGNSVPSFFLRIPIPFPKFW